MRRICIVNNEDYDQRGLHGRRCLNRSDTPHHGAARYCAHCVRAVHRICCERFTIFLAVAYTCTPTGWWAKLAHLDGPHYIPVVNSVHRSADSPAARRDAGKLANLKAALAAARLVRRVMTRAANRLLESRDADAE